MIRLFALISAIFNISDIQCLENINGIYECKNIYKYIIKCKNNFTSIFNIHIYNKTINVFNYKNSLCIYDKITNFLSCYDKFLIELDNYVCYIFINISSILIISIILIYLIVNKTDIFNYIITIYNIILAFNWIFIFLIKLLGTEYILTYISNILIISTLLWIQILIIHTYVSSGIVYYRNILIYYYIYYFIVITILSFFIYKKEIIIILSIINIILLAYVIYSTSYVLIKKNIILVIKIITISYIYYILEILFNIYPFNGVIYILYHSYVSIYGIILFSVLVIFRQNIIKELYIKKLLNYRLYRILYHNKKINIESGYN